MSECYYDEVVIIYIYEDRVNMVEMMKDNNIFFCLGVICGMGELNEDIIDMVFVLRVIDVDSIFINFLYFIKGIKFGGLDLLLLMKCLRIIVMFRLINLIKEIWIVGGWEVNLCLL